MIRARRTAFTTITRAMLSSMAIACAGSDSGSGELRVTASGEEAARTGFPAGDGDERIAFADGWRLHFDKVLVSLTGFELAASDGDRAELGAEPVVADLHLGEPEVWRFSEVPARRWDRVGFRYAPPDAGVRLANGVDPDDLEAMLDEGYSILIGATAERGDDVVELEWGFSMEVDHSRCVNGLDSTDGVVIGAGALTEAQVTVHLDHLFFDTYANDDAELRFDAMAAVAPQSGPLRLEDLAAQDNLTDLVDAEGEPLELGYDPGSSFAEIPEDLAEYVRSAAATTGHFNGEGHCDYRRVR